MRAQMPACRFTIMATAIFAKRTIPRLRVPGSQSARHADKATLGIYSHNCQVHKCEYFPILSSSPLCSPPRRTHEAARKRVGSGAPTTSVVTGRYREQPGTGWPVERREAQRPAGRPRKPAGFGRARLAGRPRKPVRLARETGASQAPERGLANPWRLPALHCPHPLGERKKGHRRARAVKQQGRRSFGLSCHRPRRRTIQYSLTRRCGIAETRLAGSRLQDRPVKPDDDNE